MSGKKRGGNRRGRHDVAPVVRGAFLRALEQIKEEDGKTFSEIIADWLREDPGAVLNAVSKFTVREKEVSGNIQHDHDHTHIHYAVQEIEGWIAGAIAREEDSGSAPSLPHRPVLAAVVRDEATRCGAPVDSGEVQGGPGLSERDDRPVES